MFQPDSTVDALFMRSFCEDINSFNMDFPVILRDFIMHEANQIPEYSGYLYASDDIAEEGVRDGLRYKFLNLLLAAARHGSDFSAQMMCRLYKTYYRSEYNQLKRFKTICYDEIVSFDSEEELFSTLAARILVIAPLMGIELDDDCEQAMYEIENDYRDPQFEFIHKKVDFEFSDETLEEARKEAHELIGRINAKKKKKYDDPLFFDDAFSFSTQVFDYHAVPSDLDCVCDETRERTDQQYTTTIALLKTLWPERKFADKEIQLYRAIYRSWTTLVDQLGLLNECIDYMIGREDRFSIEKEQRRYKPFETSVPQAVSTTKPVTITQPVVKNISQEKEKAELYSEIEKLRASLAEKEEEINHLNRMYKEVSAKEKSERLDQEKWDDDKVELHHLREHLYQMTHEDIKPATVPIQEMEKAISAKKIAIIGGHDNWVHQLKEKFPKWTYISPMASGVSAESAVRTVDYLFFFTDTMSHAVYYKYIHEVRTHNVPFDYLHGTNILSTIKQIYEFVK